MCLCDYIMDNNTKSIVMFMGGLTYIDKFESFIDGAQPGHVVIVQHYISGLHVLHYLLRNHCPWDDP